VEHDEDRATAATATFAVAVVVAILLLVLRPAAVDANGDVGAVSGGYLEVGFRDGLVGGWKGRWVGDYYLCFNAVR
jgi:hypothetical protein